MSVADQVNRVKFISEDFATYREEADQFFQTYYPEQFNNLIATDLGNALMDQLAFAMQALSFTVNRRASELFLTTARLNKSITKLARMLGYAVRPASPSTCDLTITFPNGPYAFPVIIPVGFQFQGPGDTVYEYAGSVAVTVAPGDTTVTIPVKEGVTRSLSFFSDGSENQQFPLYGISSGQYMYSEDLILTVDGVAWDRVDLISYESSNIFEVLFTESPPKLRFGDGITGNIPPVNAQIAIKFRSGKGASGAIAQNQLKNPVVPLVINGITITMNLANSVSVVGEDPEDIRHVRAYASAFFRTQNAAVVKQDYDTISALESGVALADAQIMRGISEDITIQNEFTSLLDSLSGIREANLEISNATVSGLELLGVSGVDLLTVSGISSLGVSGTGSLGVSGISSLGVSGTSSLGVSGTSYIGKDVSGNITGFSYLGVSGVGGLFVGGTSSLGVSGITFIGVSGSDFLGVSGTPGVSGIESVGIQDLSFYTSEIENESDSIEGSVSGLEAYLSQTMSDTSSSNNVQVVLLSLDSNNKYIAPSSTVITNVQGKLDSLKDAVVTVSVVDGSSKIVPASLEVDIGISQNAVLDDVETKSRNALISSSDPFGLLVKRPAGKSLYRSDIIDVIREANQAGDVIYINAKITAPQDLLDQSGNLIISKQQIIQNDSVTVKVKKRLLISGEFVDV